MDLKKQHHASSEQTDDFEKKNRLLESYGERLSPEDYYDLLFSDLGPDDRIMLVEGGKKFFTVRRDQLFDVAGGHDNIYYCSVKFYDDCKKDIFIDKVYGMVIDIDHLRHDLAVQILRRLSHSALWPTCIVNSGNGFHLIYILDKPLSVTPRIRKMIMEMYLALNLSFTVRIDRHTLGQAYRVVGSLTKSGKICTAFRVGDLWPVEAIADAVGYRQFSLPSEHKGKVVTDKMLDFARDISQGLSIPLPDLDDYDATFKYISKYKDRYIDQKKPSTRMIRSAGLISKRLDIPLPDMASYDAVHSFIGEHADVLLPPKDPDRNSLTPGESWYSWCVEKVKQNTIPGFRYSSMVALAVIARKTFVSKSDLSSDLHEISAYWRINKDWADDPFKESNIPDAIRCYDNDKLIHTGKEKLEDWLGWKFSDERNKKSKHRPQEVFLEELAQNKKERSVEKIRIALQQHPEASKPELQRLTGLNYKTVLVHYEEAAKILNNT